MTKKSVYDWELVERVPTGKFEVRMLSHGEPRIYCVYNYIYRRKTGLAPDQYEERTEEHCSTSLDNVLMTLGITNQKAALIQLTLSAFTTIDKLFQRYDWYLEEEKRKTVERNKEERAKRAKASRDRKERERKEALLRSKSFKRVVEV